MTDREDYIKAYELLLQAENALNSDGSETDRIADAIVGAQEEISQHLTDSAIERACQKVRLI